MVTVRVVVMNVMVTLMVGVRVAPHILGNVS